LKFRLDLVLDEAFDLAITRECSHSMPVIYAIAETQQSLVEEYVELNHPSGKSIQLLIIRKKNSEKSCL
jgi:hypothetical protein